MRFKSFYKYLFVLLVLLFGMIGCGGGGSSDTVPTSIPITAQKIKGFIIDEVLIDANITIFEEDGVTKLANIRSKKDGSFFVEKPKSSNSKYYILTASGGTINGENFKGIMSQICLDKDIESCNVTPYTTLLVQLSREYSGSIPSKLTKVAKEVQEILGLGEDPFMKEFKNSSVSTVNLSLWRNALANGLGLEDIIQSIQSDISDGYLDSVYLKKIFVKAKERVDTTVTESDYSINKDVEITVDDGNSIDLEHLALPQNTVVTHQMYSMRNNRKGTSVLTQGYLSDIAYIETQHYSNKTGKDNSITRIIYQSFNIGKWSDKLNTETTILSRVYISEPALLFLPNLEKERIADILVKNNSFIQAIDEYNKIITYSVDSSKSVFDDLIISLGSIGKGELESSQILTTNSILTSKLNKIVSKKSSIFESIATDKEPFQVFDGMWLGYDKTSEKLKTYSRSSLWYGLQSEKNFNNSDFLKSWSSTSLISPKVGLVSKNDLTYVKDEVKSGATSTDVDLNNIEKNLHETIAILYRNNPNSYVDAPQIMNTISLIQVLLETGGVPGGVLSKAFDVSDVSTSINKIYAKANQIQTKYQDTGKIIFAMADIGVMIYELTCTNTDLECKVGMQNSKKILDDIERLFTFSTGTSDVDNGISKDNYNKIASEVLKHLKLSENGIAISSDLNLNILKPILLAKLVIQPASKVAGMAKTDFESYQIARNLFTDKKVEAKKRFMEIWTKAVKKGFSRKKALGSIKLIEEGLKSISSLKNIKDNLSKISIQDISIEIMKSLLEEGSSIAINQLYNIAKSFTPAKIWDLTLAGNKAGAIAYDYLTDPTLVKMKIKKSGDVLDIDYAIPNMKAIRYLKMPYHNTKLVDMTIPGGYQAGKTVWIKKEKGNNLGTGGFIGIEPEQKEKDFLVGLGVNPLDNHFLVMSGFRASVENQTAYRKSDKGTVKSLLNNKQINVFWHVKKFDKASSFRKVLLKDRNKESAFINKESDEDKPNYQNKSLEDEDIPWFNSALSSNPVQKSILGDNILNYNVIDFSKFYEEEVGDAHEYALLHKTIGIFSDYTNIEFKTNTDLKRYENTINFYVLPDFTDYQENLKDNIKIYKGEKYNELQLTFKKDINWKAITGNHLNLILEFSSKTTEPLTIPISSNDTSYSYRLPKNIDINDIRIILYNDVLEEYIQQSGKSRDEIISGILINKSGMPEKPLIVLPLKDIEEVEEPLPKTLLSELELELELNLEKPRIDENEVTFKWNHLDNASHYSICVSKQPITDIKECSDSAPILNMTEKTISEFRDRPFEVGTKYYAIVKAYSLQDYKLFTYSNEQSFIISEITPTATPTPISQPTLRPTPTPIVIPIPIPIELPIADFDGTYWSDTGKFIATDKSTSSSGICKWYWEWGDGFTDKVQNPIHYYSSSGKYRVRLTVTDCIGKSSSYTSNYFNINLSKNILGGAVTDEEVITIKVRDFQIEDGDYVTIKLNGKIIFDYVELKNLAEERIVLLKEGENTIQIYAHNVGTATGLRANTAEITFDNIINSNDRFEWKLDTGESAYVYIFRRVAYR